jgi:hypothetical protein
VVKKKWTITCAALACIVIVPLVFESYTFHLYSTGDPAFFTFSGSRLWVFLISLLLPGVLIGRAHPLRPIMLCAAAAIAIAILVVIFYQFCDVRQCYHPGPDRLGEIRLAALFFSTTAIGIMIGFETIPVAGRNGPTAILFSSLATLFVGYFPWVLVFSIYLPDHSGLAMLAFASSVPFIFSGAISRLFSNDRRHAIYSAVSGWLALTVLFSGIRPFSLPLVVITLACAIPAALAGFTIVAYVSTARKELKTSSIHAALLAFFILGASHPLIDAPMNLGRDPDTALLPNPTYYSGAYHYSDTYLPSKRVEVEINLTQFDPNSVKDFLFAGIGAQSPNCCKDGLDYGYRADMFFNKSGIFLAARAWETCDGNPACSGYPWISAIHQSAVRLPADSVFPKTVMLAMEWQQDERTVKWYHRDAYRQWKEYSQFFSPEIENPYFNLGVIPVGNPFTNPDSGNAFFFQVGVSVPGEDSGAAGMIGFHCPAYYDKNGIKQCVDLEPIVRGNSHWKVLWKWGVQDTKTVVETDGSHATIKLA